MNTNIEAVLYTSKTLSNGQHPLMLRLTKNRKRKYISLHISLPAEHWDYEKCKPKRNCPNREQVEKLIRHKEILFTNNPIANDELYHATEKNRTDKE